MVSKYVQKEGLIQTLSDYKNACILCDSFIYEKYERFLKDLKVVFEAEDITECEVLIGVGGGKVLDLAKYESNRRNIKYVAVPTSCASDAPCTSVAVVEGKYVECGCPQTVLVDENVLASAPSFFLCCGIGDALTTYYESVYYESPKSIRQLAVCCRKILLEEGLQAVNDYKEGLLSSSVKDCFEAILYMSGTVFTNSGGSVAHALSYGLALFSESMHGALAAYGLLVQLFLENNEEIHELISFYKQIGLPTHLRDIGVGEDDLDEVVKRAFQEESIRKFNTVLTFEEVKEAIIMVNMFE